MQTAGVTIGVLSICGMLMAFIPCLGALNWLNIPFATMGLIINIIGYSNARPGEPRGNAVTGMVLCIVAMILGLLRLIAGGGIL